MTFDSSRGRAPVEHVVPLQRRRIPARTRLSDICGGIAGGGADGGDGSGEVEGVPRAVPQVYGEELVEEGGRLP